MDPQDAVDLYLETRENELAQATLYGYRSRLRHFVNWCRESGHEDTRDLGPRDYHEHRLWRRSQGDPGKVYMKTYQNTIRSFVRVLESIEEAPNETADKILTPSLSKGEDVADTTIESEVAQAILDHLDRYDHASRDHLSFLLAWHALLRRGAIRGIDVGDVNTDDHVIDIRHRPNTDTPLKNKERGERFVSIKPWVSDVVERYKATHRHDVTDDHGRKPLLTTSGRPHVSTIAGSIYGVTRPCQVTRECPHGRDIETCDAARDKQLAYECPSSVGPHAVRRGGITHWLTQDIPQKAIEDRANTEVISEHYDARTERQKAEQRRKYLELI